MRSTGCVITWQSFSTDWAQNIGQTIFRLSLAVAVSGCEHRVCSPAHLTLMCARPQTRFLDPTPLCPTCCYWKHLSVCWCFFICLSHCYSFSGPAGFWKVGSVLWPCVRCVCMAAPEPGCVCPMEVQECCPVYVLTTDLGGLIFTRLPRNVWGMNAT